MTYSRCVSTRIKGNKGEDIACRYLIKNGFKIEKRNYRKSWGELDIAAVKDNTIHFFEVKSIISDLEGLSKSHKPEENVHGLKLGHIRRVVQCYLEHTNRGLEAEFHFHVLCVFMNVHRRIARVKWIKDIVL